MNTRRLWLLGSVAMLVLLAGCDSTSVYGDNTETQVAKYLTETVPTAQAVSGFPTSPPTGGGGNTGGVVSDVPTQVPRIATEEEIRITRAVDGDTVELEDGRSVRLIGINTPELGQPLYTEASTFTASLVEGRVASLAYDVQRTDQFGRTLAYVYVGDVFINLEVVRAGYANAYTVQPNSTFADAFVDAEREARNESRGLWTPSSTPLNVTALNPVGDEWIEITNEGADIVEITGFTVKDEANHIYTFPQLVLLPGTGLRLYTGTGINTTDTLYWGLTETVWNDDGDAAFLRDPSGAIVDTFNY